MVKISILGIDISKKNLIQYVYRFTGTTLQRRIYIYQVYFSECRLTVSKFSIHKLMNFISGKNFDTGNRHFEKKLEYIDSPGLLYREESIYISSLFFGMSINSIEIFHP